MNIVLETFINDYYIIKSWEEFSKLNGFKLFKTLKSSEFNFKKDEFYLIITDEYFPINLNYEKEIDKNKINLFYFSGKISEDIFFFKFNDILEEILKLRKKLYFSDIYENEDFKNLFHLNKTSVKEYKYAFNKDISFIKINPLKNKFIPFISKTLYSRFYGYKEGLTAVHGGDMGDVIYSICAFKELKLKKIILNPHGFYNTKMNKKCCEIIKPFIERQGFNVEIKENVSIDDGDFFFDFFREGVRDMEKNHLSFTNAEKIFIDISPADFKAEVDPKYLADIIIGRSFRYINPIFDYYYLLSDVENNFKIGFVGLKEEYENFVKKFLLRDKVFYIPTNDALELASFIKGSKIFIGNQSMPYAIAESLKVKRIQECCYYTPNCKGTTSNSIDVLTEKDLYSAKIFLNNTLGINKHVEEQSSKTIMCVYCELKDDADLKLLIEWITHHINLKEKIGFDNIVIVDNASDIKYFKTLKTVLSEFNFNFLDLSSKKIEVPHPQNNVLNVVSFTDKISLNSDYLKPQWWRFFSFSNFLALKTGYEKLITTDFRNFVISEKMCLWIKNKRNGINCIYRTPEMEKDFSLCIIRDHEMEKLSMYFLFNGKMQEGFWYGEGISKNQYLPEFIIETNNTYDEFVDISVKKMKYTDFLEKYDAIDFAMIIKENEFELVRNFI